MQAEPGVDEHAERAHPPRVVELTRLARRFTGPRVSFGMRRAVLSF